MIGAAKRKSTFPPGLSALWSILFLVVTLCLPETRVWGFAATPQPASGVFESASPLSIGEITTAWQYDASGSPVAANRGMRLPATDGRLTGSGTLGYTTPDGRVFLDPTLKGAQRVETMRHEAVHAFLSPRGNGPVATFRQNAGQWGYDNSAFLNATEEMAAQWYATGSLRNAWNHAFNGAYTVRGGTVVTPWRWAAEGAAGAAAVGGVGYGVYKLSSDE